MTQKPDLFEPEWIFPFDGMEIGDSFFIPTLNTSGMLFNIKEAARKSETQVRCAIVVHDNMLGVRTWRIA